MKISRGPIREALVELEREGLVDRKTHKGTFVVNLTKEDIEEIHNLRSVLEQLALEYAMRFATPEDLIEMEKVISEINKSVKEDFNIHKAVELDLRFHELLVESSRFKRVINYWKNLRSQIKVLLMSRVISFPWVFNERSISVHNEIIDAIRRKDIQYGIEVMKRHFDKSFIKDFFKDAEGIVDEGGLTNV